MGIIAPISGIISVLVPFIVSLLFEGLPQILKLIGFGIAVIAVWIISQSGESDVIKIQDVKIAIIAGLGFGFFFVFIDQVQDAIVFWPLVIARVASITLLFLITIGSKSFKIPTKKQMPVIGLAGLFDVGGNAFFVLAAQAGRLDVAAILASFYPVTTVILAWLVLREQLSNRQIFGLLLSLLAIIFITA